MTDPLELLSERVDPELERYVIASVEQSGRKIVAFDDDPTGVQTVHDVPVLTDWSEEVLAAELTNPASLFFLLTNSRSMSAPAAAELNREITLQLEAASRRTGVKCSIASRSDSTLRGHFPAETDAIASVLGQVDGVVICPAFFEGGRYTIDDVHYIREGDTLVPVAESEFARDVTFGYTHSNLREWVEEKTGGAIPASHVASLPLQMIRNGGSEWVASKFMSLSDKQPVIVNATCYPDLHIVALGLLQAEAAGKRLIYRTGASFVRARAGIGERPLLTRELLLGAEAPAFVSGMVVVGSHVRRSREQLEHLLALPQTVGIEIDVAELIGGDGDGTRDIERAQKRAEEALDSNLTPVIFTSRKVEVDTDQLEIGRTISKALVEIVRGIDRSPGFIVGKGGITASDIGTRALDARRAIVLGQIRPGVPVWRLGPESRYPGLPYIVFPGNVGAPKTLAEVVTMLRANP